MSLNRSRLAATAAAALMLVVVAGCRGADTPTTTTSAGIKTDIGVTDEPCPKAIDATKGCIYLGTISDLTVGPFAPLAVPITKAQAAFWNRVNKAGGIGGYEIDVTKYVKDNKYNPQTHNEVYQEIKPNILALAQTLGSPTTAAILADLKASSIVAVPASWTSDWALRGRHPRVRCELLRRVDERCRLRQGRQPGVEVRSWPCTTRVTTATTRRPVSSTPPRSSA